MEGLEIFRAKESQSNHLWLTGYYLKDTNKTGFIAQLDQAGALNIQFGTEGFLSFGQTGAHIVLYDLLQHSSGYWFAVGQKDEAGKKECLVVRLTPSGSVIQSSSNTAWEILQQGSQDSCDTRRIVERDDQIYILAHDKISASDTETAAFVTSFRLE